MSPEANLCFNLVRPCPINGRVRELAGWPFWSNDRKRVTWKIKMIELWSKSLMIHQLRRTGIYYIGFGSPLVPRIEPSVPILWSGFDHFYDLYREYFRDKLNDRTRTKFYIGLYWFMWHKLCRSIKVYVGLYWSMLVYAGQCYLCDS